VATLVWRVKLVAERHPGVTTETEAAVRGLERAKWRLSGCCMDPPGGTQDQLGVRGTP
jgi:hypothetical protein